MRLDNLTFPGGPETDRALRGMMERLPDGTIEGLEGEAQEYNARELRPIDGGIEITNIDVPQWRSLIVHVPDEATRVESQHGYTAFHFKGVRYLINH